MMDAKRSRRSPARSTKHEFCTVVQKAQIEEQSCDAGENAWPVAREQTNGKQGQKRQYSLQSHETNSRLAAGQHEIARAIVVFAIHPGDCHEMRELPQEENGVEYPCVQTQSTRCRCPADQRWHSSRKGPDQNPQRCVSFERSVEKQVREQRDNREQSRKQMDG